MESVRLFQRPAVGVKTAGMRDVPVRRSVGGCPYTEEELSLNVRRALEELRRNLLDRQIPRAIASQPSPIAAAGNGEALAPPPKTFTPGPKGRYVVDCVNGVVRVVAVSTSPAKDGATIERNPGAVADVTPGSPEMSKLKSSARSPSCSRPTLHARASLSSRRTSLSATISCAQKCDPTTQPLVFPPDASCSSVVDRISEIVDLDDFTTGSVASWALSSRDDCIPHPKFFFKDGTLDLFVENSSYKVHRHFFEHYSTLFPAIFTCLKPASSDAASVFARSQIPIHLPDITTIDFDRLLSIIYPTSYVQHDILSTEEWISVMDLSSKLEFASIYELSVLNIGPKASFLDKAVLGKRYGIKQWVVDAYSELCTREKPLSLEEGRSLGIDLVIKINELRHELFFSAGAGTDLYATLALSSTCSLSFLDELPEKVIQHFELHAMDDGLPEGDGKYFKAFTE